MDLDERIRSIPELSGIPDLRWQELGGGLNNQNLLLESSDARLVLRLNAEVPGVDRERERLMLQAVSGSEVAPQVIALDTQAGYLITEFVDEPVWPVESVGDPQRLQDLARSLRRLHEIPIAPMPLDPVPILGEYLVHPLVQALESVDAITRSVEALQNELVDSAFLEVPPVLCHNDLLHSNILGAVRPVLIDWEFAAPGNPVLDLATFIHYHDLDHDQAEPLLEAYYGGHYGGYREELMVASRLAQALELLWLVIRSGQTSLPESAASRLRRLLLVWG